MHCEVHCALSKITHSITLVYSQITYLSSPGYVGRRRCFGVGNQVGNKRPLLKDLHDHVLLEVADKWRDLGVQLLAPDHQGVLKVIAADHPRDVVSCCKCVLEKWLDTTADATWSQLIRALRSPSIQLDYLAGQLEQILIKECETMEFCTCEDCISSLLLANPCFVCQSLKI